LISAAEGAAYGVSGYYYNVENISSGSMHGFQFTTDGSGVKIINTATNGSFSDYYGNQQVYMLADRNIDSESKLNITAVPTVGEEPNGITAVDPAGQVVSTAYYTLQGIRVTQPTASGVYILKETLENQQTRVRKQLIVIQ
jgi:hypothetical protein